MDFLDFSFPIEEFTDSEVCMHCKTEEEASAFLEFLNSIGRRWSSGDRYRGDQTRFYDHGENTCYYFNQGLYGSLTRANALGRTVLEFSDWIVEEELETDDAPLNEFFSSFSLHD